MTSNIQRSVEILADTLSSKNKDYTPAGEFSNFVQAADIAGVTVLQVITAQAAIKMTRIQALMSSNGNINHESLSDSFLDLAGYAVIAHAYMNETSPEPAIPIGGLKFVAGQHSSSDW